MKPSGDGAVALAQAALGYLLTSTGAVIVLLADDLGRRPEQLGWLASTFGAGLLVVGFGGRLLLRVDAALLLRVAAVGLAVGAVLLGTAATLPVAAAGSVVLGLGGAVVVLLTPTLITGPGSASRLQRVNAAASAASVTAPLLLGVLALTGAGRLALLAAVPPLGVLALWRHRAIVTGVSTEVAAPSVGTDTPAAGRKGVPAAWVVVVLSVSVEFCLVVWGASILRDTGLRAGPAAAMAATFPLGLAVGRLLAGRLRGDAPVASAGLVVIVGSVITVAAHSPVPAALGLLVAGLGVAPLYPAALAALVGRPERRQGDGAALGALASGAAVLLAPALLGLLAQHIDLRLALLTVIPLVAALLTTRNLADQTITSAPRPVRRTSSGRPCRSPGKSSRP